MRLSLIPAIPGKHSPTNYCSPAKSTAYTSTGTNGVVGSTYILTKSFERSTPSWKSPHCKDGWNQSPTSWKRDLRSPAFFYSSTTWQGNVSFTKACFHNSNLVEGEFSMRSFRVWSKFKLDQGNCKLLHFHCPGQIFQRAKLYNVISRYLALSE